MSGLADYPVSAVLRAENLERVRSEYKLPVIAIDYTPPGARDIARDTARKIAALGFIPWVTNSDVGPSFGGVYKVPLGGGDVIALVDGEHFYAPGVFFCAPIFFQASIVPCSAAFACGVRPFA